MNASRSACLILPAGPEPLTCESSIPASRARRLTAGLARTLPDLATGIGAGVGVGAGVGEAAGFGTDSGSGTGSGSGSGTGSDSSFGSEVGALPAEPNSTRVAPTATMPPTSPLNEAMTPLTGDGIVTVALSVMTSTIGSSSATESPTETCHCTTSPSTTPSPISGSLNT